jgi:hypothetical protein
MKITWGEAISIWFSFFWRAILIGIALGFVAGTMAGVFAGATGVPDKAALYGGIAGWLSSIPSSMIAMKLAIDKRLEDIGNIVDAARMKGQS